MTLADAFKPVEDRNAAQVMYETWGHLEPTPHTSYRGYIIFANGAYQESRESLLAAEFDGLDDSPGLYGDLQEFIQNNCNGKLGVYRFDGTYKRYKNGQPHFSGKITTILEL